MAEKKKRRRRLSGTEYEQPKNEETNAQILRAAIGRFFARFDLMQIIPLALLLTIGMCFVHSTGQQVGGHHVELFSRQCVYLAVGLALSGLGVQLVVSSDLMLPAPDELSHTISQVYSKKLSNVKIISDAIYVAIAVAVDLIFSRRVFTVGVGTLLSVLLVGRFVGWFGKLFPKLTMPPFWNAAKTD